MAGYTPIHLLVPGVLYGLGRSFWRLAQRDIAGHRRAMLIVYVGGCLVAGAFTLMPNRYLGQLVWGQWLGLGQDAASSIANAPQASMLAGIVGHTPPWVFALLVALLAYGIRQWRPAHIGQVRTAVLPAAMVGLGLYGVVGLASGAVAPLLAWAIAALAFTAATLKQPVPAGTRYDVAMRRFDVPGSALPLMLLMGIFFTRYAVGVALDMHPELRSDATVVTGVAIVYGAFGGVFAGRALRLWRLATRQNRDHDHATVRPTHALTSFARPVA